MLALNMQNKYQQAKEYLDSAKKYYAASENYDVLVAHHLVSGLVYMNLGMLDDAKENFTASLNIAEKFKAVFSIIQSRMQLARVLTMQKKFKEAEPVLLSLVDEAKKTNEISQLVVLYDYLSRLYEEWGNYDPALKYYKMFKEVSDSVASEKNKQFTAGLEVKYETEKKESRIRELEVEQKLQQLLLH